MTQKNSSSFFITLLFSAFKFLRIQLYLFIVALPFLAQWGIPISLGTFLGNMFFGPFFVLFLGVSICWMAAYCVGLPLLLPIKLLNAITAVWLMTLSYGTPSWLYAVPSLSPMVLVLLGAGTFAILYGKSCGRYGLGSEILLLTLLVGVISWGARTYARCYTSHVRLPHAGKELTIRRHDTDGLYLIDKGILRHSNSLYSWAKFTLRPALVQHFGSCYIDAVLLVVPTLSRLRVALSLIDMKLCRAIALPARYAQCRWLQEWCMQHPQVIIIMLSAERVERLCASC